MARKSKPKVRDSTPVEDAAIRKQIAADPDTWEIDLSKPPLRRGRPAGASKKQVTVRLDLEVLEALQTPEAKGWQTRLNAAARAGLKLQR